MEPVSEEQKIKEWQIQANKGRAKALRRERYFYCFAVFVFMFCLVLVASVISLIVLGIIEVIHYL